MMNSHWHAPADEPAPRRTVAGHLAVILLFVAAVVAVRAAAPSNTYNYAQFWQIRASIAHMQGDSYLLPSIDYEGSPARKPQLYAWMLTGAMKLTAALGGDPYRDFVFRIPTIIAYAAGAVLVYLLGGRWVGRSAGLMAALLWATALQMNKLAYLATTDMLLAATMLGCLFCVDRLVFHPAPKRRWAWAVGFWAMMILTGLAKGWGLVNLAIVGTFLALAGGLGPGFARAASQSTRVDKMKTALACLLKRWWAILCATHLLWGLMAMAGVFIPLWFGMLQAGGEAFREKMYFEIVQRITGQGQHAPHAASGPAVLHLLYNTLPGSILAVMALILTRPRRWFAASSPTALALWWTATVVIVFSIPAGFRPDYLLPAYAGVALLGGWAGEELSRRWSDALGKHLRRIATAIPFVLAGGLLVIIPPYLNNIAESLGLPAPPVILNATWWGLALTPLIMLAAVALGVAAIRLKRMQPAVVATALAMLAMIFLYSHLWSRQARTGDGEVVIDFARRVEPVIGEDDFVTYMAKKLGTEVYMGRFVPALYGLGDEPLSRWQQRTARWLVTTDIGLLHLGAWENDPDGSITLRTADGKKRFRPHPEDIGRVVVQSVRPIEFERWGRLYLIEQSGEPAPRNDPYATGYIPDPVK
jgi:4-amino-4-deoxy-L-arabinose transferase-like glycosyltransferase